MKKLFLIFHGRFPSEKAASIFAAKSAEAFANEEMEVFLCVPRRLGREIGSPYSYYGVSDNFHVIYLPVIDLYFLPLWKRLSFWISFVSFSISSSYYLLIKSSQRDVIYSNETVPLFFASFISPNTFYEMHDFPESKFLFFKIFLHRTKWLLIHNQWKTEQVTKQFGIQKDKIITEPNAVEIVDFDVTLSKEDARKNLSLPLDKKIAVYTGHLYSWKGTATLAESALMLPNDYLVVFVGGTAEDLKRFRETYGRVPNMLIVGWKPHSEIPLWQKAADVLVLPNTAKEKISKYYTSPMKLFEYMVSRVPVVASRIPSIEEIVTEEDVFFALADSATSFAKTIQKAVEGPEEAYKRATHAYTKVSQFTWEKRVKRILAFIGHNSVKPSLLSKSRVFFLARYLFSGLLSFTTNLFLLLVFKEYFNMWYLTASTLAFIISVIVSFAAQKFITFRDKSRDRVSRQMAWYIVIALFNVTMNAGMMFACVDLLHVQYLLAQIASAGFIALWSLAVYRYIIFTNAKIS